MSSVLTVPIAEKIVPPGVFVHTNTGEIEVPPTAFTLPGFRFWALSHEFPERGKISFLDGEVDVDMSAEELSAHNQVKTEVGRTLPNLIRKERLGWFLSDRALLTNEEANLASEPDGMFVSRKTRRSGRVRFVQHDQDERRLLEVQGFPDWVMEIVSDSSVRKDARRLRELYFRAGVLEYWLIDARGGEIDFQILVRGATGYENAPSSRGGWQTSTVFNRRLRLMRTPDEGGLWEYTLQMKPIP